jgi:hypothetical protein
LPAGMMTISAPVSVFWSPLFSGRYPDTFTGVSI